MSREELIKFVEEANLENELRSRVEEKWEMIEASLLMNRKPKYSQN
jgi:hypothetical protein